MDAQGHGLGGENHLAEPALEQELDQPLHARQHSRVVQSHAHAEGLEDGLVERRLRHGRRVAHRLADGLVHPLLLALGEERLALGQHRLHGPLAARAAEDEVDGGEPAAGFELVQHHGGVDHAPRVPPALVVVAALPLLPEEAHLAVAHRLVGVDLPRQIRHQVLEGHAAMRVRDGHDGPVHEADPVGDLRDVLDGGGEPHQGHVLGRVHDDLFPHRPASLVAHVVALVEDHELEAVEAARVEHVAEDLGGHDDHGRARVDLDVAREDAHALLAKLPAEVRVLLVRQRLERRGVGDAAPARERGVDGELGHEGLPGARGGGDDHRLVVDDGRDGVLLEAIERERVAGLEGLQQVVCHVARPLRRILSVARSCGAVKSRLRCRP